ncbi:MAG: hypothetical protein LW826_03560, partial [Candidatus Jidaibacter sp.]|nr:hypothetical protein [Candidatus Jidaibacter sp.]
YLDSQNIGENGAIAIAKALKTNTSLNLLYLFDRTIGENGAIAIAKAFKTNTSLTWLSLMDINISEKAAKALDDAIKKNENILHAFYHNQSLEIPELLAKRRNNIRQLIQSYKDGNADINQLIKFSVQVKSFAKQERSLSPIEIKRLYYDIQLAISTQFSAKCEQDILTHVINDIAPIITQYLDSKALAKLSIATCLPSLKEYVKQTLKEEPLETEFIKLWALEKQSIDKSLIEQERQKNHLLKGICAGVIASYSTHKLAHTCCDAYISETGAMVLSIIAGAAIGYGTYSALENRSVAAALAVS